MLSSPWRSVIALAITSTITSGVGFLRRFPSTWPRSYRRVTSRRAWFRRPAGSSSLPPVSPVCSPGRLMVRHHVRPLMLAGALLVGLCLVLLGRVSAVWQMFLVYFGLGVCYAFVALVPTTTLLNRWFEGKRRSIALSIAMSRAVLSAVFFCCRSLNTALIPWALNGE